jgi:multidrug transporter EmrE-like cation transporter
MIGTIAAMDVAWLLIFWAMQVLAQVIFKWGSDTPGRFVHGFIGGNLFGASSILLLMRLYKTMNVNVALGLGIGGGFLLGQVALALIFRSRVSLVQSCGIAAMVVGMLMLAMGNRQS